MEFVIIGGDAAGMSAASRAKRKRPDLAVTVFEQTRDVSYSACGMPYNIADPDRPIEDLVVRQADVFREKQKIDLRTGHCVERIDPKAKTVAGSTAEGKPFTAHYDKLLIATGASVRKPPITGIDLPGVMGLKNLADGRGIKAHLAEHAVRRVVILGMGYIALEMCESLSARGIAVDLVKPGPTLLPWLDPALTEMVRATLEAHGIGLHMGVPIVGIARSGAGLTVQTADRTLPCELVIAATGITPNSGLAADAGLALSVSKSIAVDPALRTSDPDIYAAGDCADAVHTLTGRKVWIPLALLANRAGWAVADNVCGGEVSLPGILGSAVFKVFDLEVARTGLTPSEAEGAGFAAVSIDIRTRSRAHAHPGNRTIRVQMTADKTTGRLLGAQMVGGEGCAHRINTVAAALHAGMTVATFAGCDMAYAPPFGPVWDPLLTTANQLLKKL